MWLLRTGLPLRLVWFADSRTVAFAILSHVWQANEVLFQDIQDGNAKLKLQGYEKVVGTCDQAKKDGFEYVWIDNCCIDKSSSAELSESINSMWQWYCDARVCYAYLADVSGHCPELGDEENASPHGNWRFQDPAAWPEFSRSRWFTRGWTLQELLAPQGLVFYGKDWNFVGLKRNLLNTLWTITGIDILALESRRGICHFAVARRMSWAAGRKTTRLEDRAYSLLGIFDINMPLLYGEGHKAFIRLQEEIFRYSSDHSIFAWELDKYDQPEDMLFAADPDYFRSASRLVRDTSKQASSPFWLTNQGVHFEELHTIKSGDRYLTILQYCHEDDLRGPIALCMIQQDRHLSFGAPKHVFWFPDTAVRRLTIFDRLEVEKGQDPSTGPTTIMRHQRISQFRSLLFNEISIIPKIQVKKAPGSEDFTILEAFPARSWNMSRGIMCPEIRSKVPSEVIGILYIRGDASKKTSKVAFRGSTENHENDLAEKWLACKVPFHFWVSESDLVSSLTPLVLPKVSSPDPKLNCAGCGATKSAPTLLSSSETNFARPKVEAKSFPYVVDPQVMDSIPIWETGIARCDGATVRLAEVVRVRNEPVLVIEINLSPAGNGSGQSSISTEQENSTFIRQSVREGVERYRSTKKALNERLRR